MNETPVQAGGNLPAVMNGPNGAMAAPLTTSAPVRFSEEQIDVLKQTIAKGTTNVELQLFVTVAQRMDLDPFRKEIYCVKRGGVMTIQVGVDGYRKKAEETGEYMGQVGPWWCGPNGQWTDVWLQDAPPAAAKVGVLRRGFREPVYAVARYKSYVQKGNDGRPQSQWATQPDNMLAKCAECLAIRKAFPRIANRLDQDAAPALVAEADDWQATVDTATGEMKRIPGPAYHDVKDNAAQMNTLHGIGNKIGLTPDDLHDIAAKVHGVASKKDLTRQQLSDFIDELTARQSLIEQMQQIAPSRGITEAQLLTAARKFFPDAPGLGHLSAYHLAKLFASIENKPMASLQQLAEPAHVERLVELGERAGIGRSGIEAEAQRRGWTGPLGDLPEELAQELIAWADGLPELVSEGGDSYDDFDADND